VWKWGRKRGRRCAVTTLRRSEYHQSVLVGNITRGSQNFQNLIDGAKQLYIHSGMSPPDALHKALASVYRLVQAQSATLAYIDTFMVLPMISAIMFVLSFTLKKNEPGAGGAAAIG